MKSLIMFSIDIIFVILGTLLALALRFDFSLSVDVLENTWQYLWFSVLFAGIAILATGQHRTIWRLSTSQDFRRAIGVAIVTVAGSEMTMFVVNRLQNIPRSLPLLQLGSILALMLGARFLVRSWREVRNRRSKVQNTASMPPGAPVTVLLVGVNALAELYMRATDEWAPGRIEIAGILGRSEQQVGRQVQSHRVLGMPDDLLAVLRQLEIEGVVVDRIMVATPLMKLSPHVRETLLQLRNDKRIRVDVLPNLMGLGADGDAPREADDLRGLRFTDDELELVRDRPYFRFKRLCDAVGALVLLILGFPLIVLTSLLVVFDLGFPILFCQRRPGRWGTPITVYKFRTMAEAYDRNGRRVQDEERSSLIGKLLRRLRLDEIPQLYNVLIGEMSFVGPRPLLPVDQSADFKARLLVRPGITGYAQVMGGRVVSPADKAALDVWYVRNASPRLDLSILASTVPMILFGDRVNGKALTHARQEILESGDLDSASQRTRPETTAIPETLGTVAANRRKTA